MSVLHNRGKINRLVRVDSPDQLGNRDHCIFGGKNIFSGFHVFQSKFKRNTFITFMVAAGVTHAPLTKSPCTSAADTHFPMFSAMTARQRVSFFQFPVWPRSLE